MALSFSRPPRAAMFFAIISSAVWAEAPIQRAKRMARRFLAITGKLLNLHRLKLTHWCWMLKTLDTMQAGFVSRKCMPCGTGALFVHPVHYLHSPIAA